MRLSKIKLAGFKSFVDPTTVRFPSNLMGIVGPNGCGKSNIIDAIRWVLGEASAKNLRGDSMVDVIFNGSANRKPVGVASIELVFDNSDGKITGPYAGYSEIAVRRVVSRDGTSQYYLNNGRCRRKDITHILLGTGVGSHGYSIIEQGMISRLIEAKPEELRAFLEEAAGISKYKERRKETEHRIQHTRENLERLADLRDELDKQLGHLQRQAKDAERYKTLRAEQRKVNAELLALRLNALRAEVAAHEAEHKEKRLALEAAIAAQRTTETTIEKLRLEQAERNEAFGTAQGNYYRIGAEIARLEQSIQHRKQVVQRQSEDLAVGNQQIAELRAHIESDEVELAQHEQVLSELRPDLEQAYVEQRTSQGALDEAEQAMEQWRKAWEQVSEELAATERAAQVEDTKVEQLTTQGERLDKEHDKHVQERGALSFVELEKRLETLIGHQERLSTACIDATRALESVWAQIQHLREQDNKVSQELDELRARSQNDRGRLASLEALQEAAFGKPTDEVISWLEARSLVDQEHLAQQLGVDAGWERAVETVLGAYLQALSVDSLDSIAASLPQIKGGGITLLEKRSTGAPSAAVSDMLLAHVRGPDAITSLLAGVRVAETLETAVAQRTQLRDGESIVTRDGVWIGPQWLRINRTDDPQIGVIARGEEIRRLRDSIHASHGRADQVAQTLNETRAELERLEQERVRTQSETNRRQQLHSEAKAQLGTCKSELDQNRSRAATLDVTIEELRNERQALAAAVEECRARSAAAAQRNQQLSVARENLERDRRDLQERLTAARARAEEHRVRAQEIAIQVESRRSSKESASAALARVQNQHAQLSKRQRELQAEIDAAAPSLEAEEAQLTARLDLRLGAESLLTSARAATEDVETQLREAEHERNGRQQTVSDLREAADTVRLAVREAQVRAEAVTEQFNESGFELATVLAELPSEADATRWHETADALERRIQRLGAINLAAIEELREQSERKSYLDSQFNDLTEALATLEDAIRKIDRETRARFKETFDKANQGLGTLFPRLFGGGHAYLELDGDDLLASGVTVLARPPGKKISTIHLMSGGEKALTAIALVFSIFQLNPAPFCLLDEVDAPLDDANVGRFSDIVKEMSEHVQFVIITHNKTTMETMHQLTGVTMHEPGVSRMVAVDIDEAVKLAAM